MARARVVMVRQAICWAYWEWTRTSRVKCRAVSGRVWRRESARVERMVSGGEMVVVSGEGVVEELDGLWSAGKAVG